MGEKVYAVTKQDLDRGEDPLTLINKIKPEIVMFDRCDLYVDKLKGLDLEGLSKDTIILFDLKRKGLPNRKAAESCTINMSSNVLEVDEP